MKPTGYHMSELQRGRRPLFFEALICLTMLAGCMVTPAAVKPIGSSPDVPMAPDSVYRIGVPDLLNIKVWEQDELSGSALVRSDGKISIALAGDISAEGRTPEELASEIEKVLAEFVAAPKVDVSVLEMRSQVVSVIGGGIQRSGVIELRHDMRVLDAIAEMGGLTPFAKKRQIRVLRKSGQGEVEIPFDYSNFIDGRAPGSNFLLLPGDTVVVPE